MAIINQCDKCGATIELTETFRLSVSRFVYSLDLCRTCAQPVLTYLSRSKLLDKLDISYMQTGQEEVS